jgi:glutamate 5-kinase
MTQTRKALRKAKRIVVKIGTKSLTNDQSKLDEKKVAKFVKDIMALRKRGKEVLVVTSGAVGAGVGRLGLKERPKQLPLLQAAASVGQGILMQVYEKNFSKYRQPISQMLLSAEDFSDQARYQNFKGTLAALLKLGVVPVINENDTVAVEEIRVGDNDLLSAYVAKGVKADLLVILSDVGGLYTGHPCKKDSKLIKTVDRVTPKIERIARSCSKGFGGILTKVQAARMTSEAGISVVVANSGKDDVLLRILKGEEVGTVFLPRGD